jgi:hypothetical protein
VINEYTKNGEAWGKILSDITQYSVAGIEKIHKNSDLPTLKLLRGLYVYL